MNQGERAARERVEAVYAAVDRLTPDDLRLTPIADRDMGARETLVAEIEDLADRNGRGDLLDEARGWLREAIAARTLARYHPEAGAWGVPAGGLVADQVGMFLALEDTVSVAVVEDVLLPNDAAVLSDPGRQVLGMEPLPASGTTEEPAAHAWEPSAAEWSAAEWSAASHGDSAVDPDQPLAGGRTLRRTFFFAVGAAAVVSALLFGFGSGQPVLGILGAIAAAAVAWTFATWRSARQS